MLLNREWSDSLQEESSEDQATIQLRPHQHSDTDLCTRAGAIYLPKLQSPGEMEQGPQSLLL